jgi:hypothetical protein
MKLEKDKSQYEVYLENEILFCETQVDVFIKNQNYEDVVVYQAKKRAYMDALNNYRRFERLDKANER